MTSKINGIVIYKQEYQAFDEIVTIYTKHGLCVIYCPGVRKITSKNQVFLQIFNLCEFEVFQARTINKMHRLKTAVLISVFKNIQQDYSRTMVAIYFINLYQTVTTISPIEIFQKLSHILTELNNIAKEPKKIFCFYTLPLLVFLGLQLRLNCCTLCLSKQNIKTLNWSDGGFICKNCFKETQHHLLPMSLLKSIANLANNSLFDEWVIEEDDKYILIKFYCEYLIESGAISYYQLKSIKEQWTL